ncbi:FAD-binding protein [Chimaeribacter californicus]|uniref:FAD-binding protein n=1 Tax=Chimaeribacter californicus TaxID=2060067 RepID=A0A2N5DZM4_9GAMM|nr:FAD-binding oxidoreductase [Chimaeribacter californicus]PLR33306.1 FAD-binding protein [Chimaeribacter californicus]
MSDSDRRSALAALVAALPELDWIKDAPKVKRLSRDFHWFSPVLKPQLEHTFAELAVRPRDEQELAAIVAACAKQRVPLNLRGGGTGNYGQLIPLDGGVMVDMTRLNAVIAMGQGTVRAQAGIRLGDLESHTRPLGWELRCMPSTWKLATLGGLFGGGFGGVGSINYGPLAAPGNVLSVRIMTMEETPRILTLQAPHALLLHHAYGSNGIVLEIELALAPRHDWIERLDTFADFPAAMAFADALARSPGLVKRQIAVFAAPVLDYFTDLAQAGVAGRHGVISVVGSESDALLPSLLTQHEGRNALHFAQGENTGHSLIEYCWNHTTLQALKTDKTLTYLQTAYSPENYARQVLEMETQLSDEVMSHIEFLRDMDGALTCSGLPLVRYSGEDRLNAIMESYRSNGVKINNPHVLYIEDGKQGKVRADVVAMKRACDPYNLLNPGKLRGWEVRDTLPDVHIPGVN